ncbi:MAG: aminopeptidase 1 [Planctomycetes bacterium]|nr:aminopeptidase 1 [Planctomycetota bacterium]
MRRTPAIFLLVLLATLPAAADDSAWSSLAEEDRAGVESTAGEFLAFIAKARTERTAVRELVAAAEAAGFRALGPDSEWKPGARFYDTNRSQALVLVVCGEKPASEGLRVAAGHVDSPHLSLKSRPVYSSWGFALLQTNSHGGIKNYQWANVPLALLGEAVKKDGTRVEIEFGLSAEDGALVIPDLAPHEDKEYRDRKQTEVLGAEELDPIAASKDSKGKSVEDEVWDLLRSRYGLEKDDLVSAELAIVPANEPRSVGLDGSMIGAYGLDDRLCSWASARSLLEIGTPPHASVVYLTDNEEVGSVGNTGAGSAYFTGLVGRLLALEGVSDENRLRQALRRSLVLSADCTTGVHPTFSGAHETTNAARLGRGVVLKMYGKGMNANPTFTAHVRRILDEGKTPWQVHTYKVGVGGGGTIGQFFTALDMEVIDVGVPLLAMHSPFEIASKVDLWHYVRFTRSFFEDPGALD